MSGRPRILMRSRLKSVPSAIRKMERRRKGSGPPRRPKISSGMKSNATKRRSQSSRPSTKSTLPRSPTKRGLPLSPKYSLAARKSKESTRMTTKRSRASPSSRITLRRGPQSPVLSESRHRSRESRGRPERDRHSSADRPSRGTSEKKYVDKCPSERAPPVKEFKCDREDLKKLTMTICRNISGGSTQIHRTIVHPEDIKIVRRPASNRAARDYVDDLENVRLPRSAAPIPVWSLGYPPGRGREDRGGEGSAPIFDRQEMIESRRKYDDDYLIPANSDRMHYEPPTLYNGGYRMRDYYSQKEKERDVSGSRRSIREFEYKPARDCDPRYQNPVTAGRNRSYDRSKNYPAEKKERFGDRSFRRRRSRSPGRSRDLPDDRMMRRRFSPVSESRRHTDPNRDYEYRRERSPERREVDQSHFRDYYDYPSGGRYPTVDHSSKSHGYYQIGSRENPSSRGHSGGGGNYYSRGRGEELAEPSSATREYPFGRFPR